MVVKSKVKYIQSLSHKKQRDADGVFVAEGPKIVHELLAEKQLAAARESAEAAAAQRAAREAEDAFSAAVAFERVPASRY